jgi:Tol biopolymer transport system component
MSDARARAKLILTAAACAVALGAWFTLTHQVDRAISVRPGSTTRLTSDPGMELDPALSPDGSTLAYSAGAPGWTRIRLRRLADGSTRWLTDGATTTAERWPQWSPDGAQIAFHALPRQADGTTAGTPPHLFVAPATGGTPRLILDATTMRRALAASWFPDRPAIVFGGTGGIYSLEMTGGAAPKLLASGTDTHSPRWSPDGRWLAYVESGLGYAFGGDTLGIPSASRLIVHPVNSTATIALTEGYTLATNPVWLPDSRTILFIGTHDGVRAIFQLRIASQGSTGNDPQRFTAGLSAHTMSISPDGRQLLYSSYPPGGSIWSVPLPSTGPASMADAIQLTPADGQIEKLALAPGG